MAQHLVLLAGSTALSPFRLDALVTGLQSCLPGFSKFSISADYVYLLNTAEITEDDLKKAVSLLNAVEIPVNFEGFFVTPRKGTISPWSSKATDIFHSCGIESVQRVERGIQFRITAFEKNAESARMLDCGELLPAAHLLYDRMTEGMYTELGDFFDCLPPAPGRSFDVLNEGVDAIRKANEELGLAISDEEMNYLAESFKAAGRNPTDTELVMFGQVNSEHCRHKIFGAQFIIDGKKQKDSLFGMIKNTHAKNGKGTLVAYKDNSSVVKGFKTEVFAPVAPVDAKAASMPRPYEFSEVQLDQLMKVETHNHPTAISPFPGAATGVGGEIRDEAATGSGSRTVAGICGFMVSNLHIPGGEQPWEKTYAEFPRRLASPLDIMIDGPLGGAAFGNEFGRPQLTGFFRTYEEEADGSYRGYHKPIMLAGGHGTIIRDQVQKKAVKPGALIVQIGGPAMRIGLGGGAASSMTTGTNDEALDFNSVQRGNAEMQRRCQGVINACASMGKNNPVVAIHDIGAGGLSNGCPELAEATGAKFELRAIHNEEPSMSPMEIWCCESQERYVLALRPEAREFFEALCRRERCPVAFLGVATGDGKLVLSDSHFGDNPIDMDINVLLGKPPRMVRDVKRVNTRHAKLNLKEVEAEQSFFRLLHLPTIADKTFLITITDRSVTGMVARDQMAGPYQLPVSDCAVTTMGYKTLNGQAMATGERTPSALISGPVSARLAIAEALTNLAAADCGDISNVRLSANWMAPCGEAGEDAKLYDTVKEAGLNFCPALGISIPVGKDSCSMRTVWTDSKGESHKQVAPLSLIVSSFAPVKDASLTLTPDLKPDGGKSVLLYVDLGHGKYRLGASCLAQVYNQLGDEPADADAKSIKAFFNAMQKIVRRKLALAYHDRSDGGLAVTLAEMAISGGRGVDVQIADSAADPLAVLFSEEPGAVLQVADSKLKTVMKVFADAGLSSDVSVIGRPAEGRKFEIRIGGRLAIATDITAVRRAWSETTYRMQALRDNPVTARQEYDNALDENDRGMNFSLTYDPDAPVKAKSGKKVRKPRVAILREQGVNGHIEMAAAFALAGFESVDVHMSDLLAGRADLADFSGLVACGGFSYGDVLGAGSGWARSILFNPKLKKMFKTFFHRPDTFSLGVCNGCQMLSQLKDLIPGAKHWPEFKRNVSEQFEARFCTIELMDSPSIFFKGMAGSKVPIAVAHGEGRAVFANAKSQFKVQAAARYVDSQLRPTERYPFNPNGTKDGLTAFTSDDGRATIMMPHPERGFRASQLSYKGGLFGGECGPWMRMFRNAYAFAAK